MLYVLTLQIKRSTLYTVLGCVVSVVSELPVLYCEEPTTHYTWPIEQSVASSVTLFRNTVQWAVCEIENCRISVAHIVLGSKTAVCVAAPLSSLMIAFRQVHPQLCTHRTHSHTIVDPRLHPAQETRCSESKKRLQSQVSPILYAAHSQCTKTRASKVQPGHPTLNHTATGC